MSKAYGPALLFENVRGYDIPVLINAFGSTKRMAMSLGVDELDDVAEDIVSFMEIADQVPQTIVDKVKLLPKIAQVAAFIPRTVRQGICQEVVETNPSLDSLPVLKCWPEDAGRFITLPQVYTRDPETGKRNVGMYRMQVFDDHTTGMHWHTHHDGAQIYKKNCQLGKPTEVAVALGVIRLLPMRLLLPCHQVSMNCFLPVSYVKNRWIW